MEKNRRDILKKVGLLGAAALALVGVERRAKATAASNPLLGLWDMVIPGKPTLYYKYSICEGAYVATGSTDFNTDGKGSKSSPTMGTYILVSPNVFRVRERSWTMDSNGDPSGSAEFLGTFTVDGDRNSFKGSGTYTQYNLKGVVVFKETKVVLSATKFPA